MYTTNLRKVGGSVVLAVPPALMDQLHLEAGQTLGITIDGEKLVLERKASRPKYTLDELLSSCDPAAPVPDAGNEWLENAPTGIELL